MAIRLTIKKPTKDGFYFYKGAGAGERYGVLDRYEGPVQLIEGGKRVRLFGVSGEVFAAEMYGQWSAEPLDLRVAAEGDE